MKKTTLILIMLIASVSYSQDAFTFNQNGLQPKFLVNSIDSLDQSQLYTKSINWIKNNFKNPDEVIDTTIENEMIRITGIDPGAVKVGSVVFDIKYTIKISFKNNRYKFEPLSIKCKSQGIELGWIDFSLTDGHMYFDKNNKVIKKFKAYTIEIPAALNELNENLINYINSNSDGW